MYVKKPRCPKCGKKCASNLALGSHLRWVHKVPGSSMRSAEKRTRARTPTSDQTSMRAGAGKPGRRKAEVETSGVRLVDAIGVLEHEVATMQHAIATLKAML